MLNLPGVFLVHLVKWLSIVAGQAVFQPTKPHEVDGSLAAGLDD